MPSKIQTPTIFDNLWLGPRKVEVPTLTEFTSALVSKRIEEAGVFMQERLLFENETAAVVDSGGVNGGWLAELLGSPQSDYVCLAGFLDVDVLSVGAGISASGTVTFGLGTAATTTGSIAGTSANLAAAAAVALTGGAGSATGRGPAAPTFVDIAAAANIYLNVAVADADITADANVVFNATVRLFLLDLQGA